MKLVFGWVSRYAASMGRFDWYINEKYFKKKKAEQYGNKNQIT